MAEQCLYDLMHPGPFERCMWATYLYNGKQVQHQGLLCEECARGKGAWKLPVKLTTVYPDLLTKEDSKHDDYSQHE